MKPQDTITIAPGVLLTIVRLAALSVDGVAGMGHTPGGVGRLLRRTPGAEGVRIDVEDNTTTIELFLVLRAGTNIREVSRAAQSEVARAIHDIVGLDVLSVDVHIENIDFGSAPES